MFNETFEERNPSVVDVSKSSVIVNFKSSYDEVDAFSEKQENAN